MIVLSDPIRTDRVLKIANRIKRAEKAFVKAHRIKCYGSMQRKFFYTNAPHLAVYGSVFEVFFSQALEYLQLPSDLNFVDLGSGFGGICFTSGLYFQRAVGFELDARIFQEAERLKSELNFRNNVSFRNEDFLGADWSEFGVIFIFEPFTDRLEHRLAQKMHGIEPGTIVMPLINSRARRNLMAASRFRRILPKTEPDDQKLLYPAYERI